MKKSLYSCISLHFSKKADLEEIKKTFVDWLENDGRNFVDVTSKTFIIHHIFKEEKDDKSPYYLIQRICSEAGLSKYFIKENCWYDSTGQGLYSDMWTMFVNMYNSNGLSVFVGEFDHDMCEEYEAALKYNVDIVTITRDYKSMNGKRDLDIKVCCYSKCKRQEDTEDAL